MNVFLLDLWHDLREKRLWPVAVVLLLGLVAVPVLLAKPAEDPGPAPVVSAGDDEKAREALAALAKVKLGEEEAGQGSTLGVFDPENPFSPPKGTIKKDEPKDGKGGGKDADKDADAAKAGGGGSSDDDAKTDGGTTTGGTDTGGDDTGDGTTTTTTTVYKYVVDVTFQANGRTRRVKGLEKLDMLPNDSSPLLIFMGVTAKGAEAVFLVDSTLEAAGEGRCKPSPAECAFAYVGAGAEYVFTEDDGDTYTIRIDEIRKVKVSGDAKAAKGGKARASVGPQRRFEPPVLADLVVVASDSLENSNNDHESR